MTSRALRIVVHPSTLGASSGAPRGTPKRSPPLDRAGTSQGRVPRPTRDDPSEIAFRMRLHRHVDVPQKPGRGYGIDRETVRAWFDDPSEDVRVQVLKLAAPIATREDWAALAAARGEGNTRATLPGGLANQSS